jgi:hypothetical protein
VIAKGRKLSHLKPIIAWNSISRTRHVKIVIINIKTRLCANLSGYIRTDGTAMRSHRSFLGKQNSAFADNTAFVALQSSEHVDHHENQKTHWAGLRLNDCLLTSQSYIPQISGVVIQLAFDTDQAIVDMPRDKHQQKCARIHSDRIAIIQ